MASVAAFSSTGAVSSREAKAPHEKFYTDDNYDDNYDDDDDDNDDEDDDDSANQRG